MKILLFLILALAPLSTFGNSETIKSNIKHCDKIYFDYFFEAVPDSVFTICKNRFIFLTNKEKAKMRNSSAIYR